MFIFPSLNTGRKTVLFSVFMVSAIGVFSLNEVFGVFLSLPSQQVVVLVCKLTASPQRNSSLQVCRGFRPKVFHFHIKVLFLLLEENDNTLVGDSLK